MCKHIMIQNFQPSDMDVLGQFTAKTYDNDGFGAIVRTKSNELLALKSLCKADLYLRLGALIGRDSVRDIVVHHRTSTNKSGLDYAHPFEFQGYMLTHNGVVDVPDKHETKTTNDSEALLHHLIKTNFETTTIQGYFSCFILNHESSIVLVDDIAPMFTDGRIFSSHNLGESFQVLKLTKRTIMLDGKCTDKPIQVTKTSYGSDKTYLSLGKQYSPTYYNYSDDYDDNGIDLFFRYVSFLEEEKLVSMSFKKRKKAIKSIAAKLVIRLSDDDIEYLAETYDSYHYSGNYRFG